MRGWHFITHLGVKVYLKSIVLGAVVFVGSIFGDIPFHDFWFWSTLYLLCYRNFVASIISGMPEPSETSSDGYLWAYRSLHAMDRRISPYRLHKSFWKVFEMKEKGQ